MIILKRPKHIALLCNLNKTSDIPSQKETVKMRHTRTIFLLLAAIALVNLACGKSNSAASMPKEEKYKIYYASTVAGDNEFKKDVIKRLGVGDGSSPIPDHEFFIAFIDWMKTDEGNKALAEVPFNPKDARDYVNKHLPK